VIVLSGVLTVVALSCSSWRACARASTTCTPRSWPGWVQPRLVAVWTYQHRGELALDEASEPRSEDEGVLVSVRTSRRSTLTRQVSPGPCSVTGGASSRPAAGRADGRRTPQGRQQAGRPDARAAAPAPLVEVAARGPEPQDAPLDEAPKVEAIEQEMSEEAPSRRGARGTRCSRRVLEDEVSRTRCSRRGARGRGVRGRGARGRRRGVGPLASTRTGLRACGRARGRVRLPMKGSRRRESRTRRWPTARAGRRGRVASDLPQRRACDPPSRTRRPRSRRERRARPPRDVTLAGESAELSGRGPGRREIRQRGAARPLSWSSRTHRLCPTWRPTQLPDRQGGSRTSTPPCTASRRPLLPRRCRRRGAEPDPARAWTWCQTPVSFDPGGRNLKVEVQLLQDVHVSPSPRYHAPTCRYLVGKTSEACRSRRPSTGASRRAPPASRSRTKVGGRRPTAGELAAPTESEQPHPAAARSWHLSWPRAKTASGERRASRRIVTRPCCPRCRRQRPDSSPAPHAAPVPARGGRPRDDGVTRSLLCSPGPRPGLPADRPGVTSPLELVEPFGRATPGCGLRPLEPRSRG
jgi:hypothetical protein